MTDVTDHGTPGDDSAAGEPGLRITIPKEGILVINLDHDEARHAFGLGGTPDEHLAGAVRALLSANPGAYAKALDAHTDEVQKVRYGSPRIKDRATGEPISGSAW